MSTLVGPKGQVTIEKDIRDKLGIGPGWRAVQSVRDGQVIMNFVPPKHNRSLAGILYDPDGPKFLTNEALEEAIERSWEEAATERYCRLTEDTTESKSE